MIATIRLLTQALTVGFLMVALIATAGVPA